MKEMFCKRCGAALPSEGYICKKCGAMMSEEQIIKQKSFNKEKENKFKVSLMSDKYNSDINRDYGKRKENKFLGLIIVLVILIVLIIIGILKVM